MQNMTTKTIFIICSFASLAFSQAEASFSAMVARFNRYTENVPQVTDSGASYYGVSAAGRFNLIAYMLRQAPVYKENFEEKFGIYFNDLIGFEAGFGNGAVLGVAFGLSAVYANKELSFLVGPRFEYSALPVLLNDNFDVGGPAGPGPIGFRYGLCGRFKRIGLSYDFGKGDKNGMWEWISHALDARYFFSDDLLESKFLSFSFTTTTAEEDVFVYGRDNGKKFHNHMIFRLAWGMVGFNFGS